MTNLIEVRFNDFKTLSKDRRIYYYIGEDFFEFYFTSDGVFVKSSIQKDEIEDLKRFFSEKMFYGAMEIKFSLSSKTNIAPTEMSSTLIDMFQDVEVKNENIQKEGVDE